MKRLISLGIAGSQLLFGAAGFSEAPSWWIERGVLDPHACLNDYAPVNQGQLKQIAHQAALELQQTRFGAGEAILDKIDRFSQTNNHLPVNLGQLKHLAALFYDRLAEIGLINAWPAGMSDGPYPWSGSPHPAQDFAIANIGQVKYLFSFDIQVDSDGDGLPDWWELFYFGSATGAVASADPDGDGVTNLEEYQAGTHPLLVSPVLAHGAIAALLYEYDEDGRYVHANLNGMSGERLVLTAAHNLSALHQIN